LPHNFLFENILLFDKMKQNQEYLQNELRENLVLLKQGYETLDFSFQKCKIAGIKDKYTDSELESFEALTSRFARLSDILTQKVLHTVFLLLKETPRTFIDKVHFAEKIELIENADELLNIRDLRNEISHEYKTSDLNEIFEEVLYYTEILLKIVNDLAQNIKILNILPHV